MAGGTPARCPGSSGDLGGNDVVNEGAKLDGPLPHDLAGIGGRNLLQKEQEFFLFRHMMYSKLHKAACRWNRGGNLIEHGRLEGWDGVWEGSS